MVATATTSAPSSRGGDHGVHRRGSRGRGVLDDEHPTAFDRRPLDALLVAPPDCERESMRHMLPSWSPIPLQKLPFPSVLFASSNAVPCSMERLVCTLRLIGVSCPGAIVGTGVAVRPARRGVREPSDRADHRISHQGDARC